MPSTHWPEFHWTTLFMVSVLNLHFQRRDVWCEERRKFVIFSYSVFCCFSVFIIVMYHTQGFNKIWSRQLVWVEWPTVSTRFERLWKKSFFQTFQPNFFERICRRFSLVVSAYWNHCIFLENKRKPESKKSKSNHHADVVVWLISWAVFALTIFARTDAISVHALSFA